MDATEAGPRAVDAGTCARCEVRPRLLPTCGPTSWTALCRDGAATVGTHAWCDGHREDAEELLAWAATLPPWWADAVVLWWVGTGEVAWDGRTPDTVPAPVRATLPVAGGRH